MGWKRAECVSFPSSFSFVEEGSRSSKVSAIPDDRVLITSPVRSLFSFLSIKIMPESAIKFFSYESSVRFVPLPFASSSPRANDLTLPPFALTETIPRSILGQGRRPFPHLWIFEVPLRWNWRFDESVCDLPCKFASSFPRTFFSCPSFSSRAQPLLYDVTDSRSHSFRCFPSSAGNAEDPTHDDGGIESQLQDPAQERSHHVADGRNQTVLPRSHCKYSTLLFLPSLHSFNA